jgi:hypothetical protein
MTVEVLARPVVPHSSSGVSVPGCDLYVA